MKIICPKHGHIIPLHTCSHIREQVQTCSCCIAEKDFKILTIRYEWMTPVNDDEKMENINWLSRMLELCALNAFLP